MDLAPWQPQSPIVTAIRPESYGNATGSDGTSAMQSAINAASAIAQTNAAGIIDVLLTPGAEYNWGQLTLQPGVRIRAYGAIINPILAEINQALLYFGAAGNVSRFEVLGGDWLGTGSEGAGAPTQFLFEPDVTHGLIDGRFQDMNVSNWGAGPLYIRNPGRVLAINNKMSGVGAQRTYNAINFVFSEALRLANGAQIIAQGNIIDGCRVAAIAAVVTGGAATGPIRALFTNNITTGNSITDGNSGAILFEVDVATSVSDATIADNDINQVGTAAGAYAVLIGSTSATTIQKVKIDNNRIKSGQVGVNISGAAVECDVTNNRFDAPTPISGTPTFKSGNRYSTGPMQGRATLVAGTVTVNTAEVQANDNILVSYVNSGSTGVLRISAIVAGTSFTIASSQGADTGTVYWRIDH